MISVCICTFKRPEKLMRLLLSIRQQNLTSQAIEIVVVDNDVLHSANQTFRRFSEKYPDTQMVYDVEPVQNIALARNRSVNKARGEYIAFIDDDEEASPKWLQGLLSLMNERGADAVAGPVEAALPDNAPAWIRKGGFFERPRFQTGTILEEVRTGNVLVKRKWFDSDAPFNPSFGLTGGEDTDFFSRMKARGAAICWSDDAVVYEDVDPGRMNLKWLLMRSFRGGQGYSEKIIKDREPLFKLLYLAYRVLLCGFALCMALASMPFGFHRCVWWLRKVFSNLGQVSAVLPYRYAEYKISPKTVG